MSAAQLQVTCPEIRQRNGMTHWAAAARARRPGLRSRRRSRPRAGRAAAISRCWTWQPAVSERQT